MFALMTSRAQVLQCPAFDSIGGAVNPLKLPDEMPILGGLKE
jgi:hypothetical protein